MLTRSWSICRARREDSSTIAAYNCNLARETEGKDLDPAIVLAGVSAALLDPDRKGVYFLVWEARTIVGQLLVTTEWSDWRAGWFWWIQSVYVRPESRGRGVYRALYEHVRSQARLAGDVVGLRLYVEHDNHRAQAAYERLGMAKQTYHFMEEDLLTASPRSSAPQ